MVVAVTPGADVAGVAPPPLVPPVPVEPPPPEVTPPPVVPPDPILPEPPPLDPPRDPGTAAAEPLEVLGAVSAPPCAGAALPAGGAPETERGTVEPHAAAMSAA